MGESIFVRVQRVVSAGVDSAVGTVERANNTGLMHDAMREADRAIDRLVAERDGCEARRRNAEARTDALRRELATLDESARFALGKERPDLAEAAVTRQVEVEEQLTRLEAVRSQAVADDARLEGVIADLRQRRRQMKEELVAFREARDAAAAVDAVAAPLDVAMARKVSRAEEAFDRALEAAGGASGRGGQRDDEPLAEIAVLKKQAAVAARLAALKAGEPAAPAAKRPARGNRA